MLFRKRNAFPTPQAAVAASVAPKARPTLPPPSCDIEPLLTPCNDCDCPLSQRVSTIHSALHASPACDACNACDDVCVLPDCAACGSKKALLSSRRAATCAKGKNVVSTCQLRRHNTRVDCWISAHGFVYDVTAFLAGGTHPGGENSILRHAGMDCTADFEFHRKAGKALWKQCRIGHVKACPKARRSLKDLMSW